MSRIADTFVSCYPNAGLPNAFGEYEESPARQAGYIAEFAEMAWSTWSVVAAEPRRPYRRDRRVVEGKPPRRCPRSRSPPGSRDWNPEHRRRFDLFVNIGERTNITGSARFRNLIKAGDYDTACRWRASRWRWARRSSTSTWTRA